MSAWYLVQCKPREAERAQEHLQNQNFDCFLPMHPMMRKRSGKFCRVVEPLFPYYLFINLDEFSNWRVIRSTRGVARVVSFNGQPQIVSDEIIEGLKRQCAQLDGSAPEPIFTSGERVMITEGCFKDLEAIVQTARGDERVVLLLNLLNRTQPITLPVHAISKMR
ncbi:transcription/translation regulatory transformer protein RfaH [Marinimicrobium alkaliphilum]|uniref:transcription/translation regulatory transformer protein RfaH n=1 Tax=Marinimicrobium alkaliphilum TaxID=2202654 RepID=UPI0018E080E8|nr:transcription/translation regulatory transformer protein RfaH [Marinimicrobium alkaliphilum]